MGKEVTCAVLVTRGNVIFEVYFFAHVSPLQRSVSHPVSTEELVCLTTPAPVHMDL